MSKEIDQNTKKNLEILGFSEKETQVYVELLQGGEMSAIRLSKATNLHKQFVYNALKSLEEKGIVLQIGEKRSKWRALNPRKLITLAEEREKKAKEASRALLEMVSQKAGQEFSVTEGRKAFQERSIEEIKKTPKNSTIFMICGEWQLYFDQIGEFVHEKWDKIRIERGIKFKIVGPESLRTSMSLSSGKRELLEYRVMPGLEKNLVNTIIYGDTVDFEIFGDPHLTFSIKNEDVAESQRRFFEAIWEVGKK